MPANLETSASGHSTGKGQFSFLSQIKAKPKNVQTTAQLHSFISHTSKVMLKILQARLQQYVNQELPDIQAGFRKGRCCKLVEQRPEPARRLKGAANCVLAIVLVSMSDRRSWGRMCSLLHLTACPCVCPHGNKTRCS